jgi:2-oxoglutarate dehydrogenase E1 component
VAHYPVITSFAQRAKDGTLQASARTASSDGKQVKVLQMINAYRFLGNRWAQLDPLKRSERPSIPELEPSHYGFTEADLGQQFQTGSFAAVPESATLREILEALERYLHTKYVGQKRFSLEGGDSLIPLMDTLVQRAGTGGVKEMVIGMAHRGRLNVLINTLGKAPNLLFAEFEGKHDDPEDPAHSGDVKYHMGFSSDVQTPGGPMHLALGFNPSHLEIIDPVIAGSVRARQARRRDEQREQVVPVLIHGDSAFAGQGVVMELLQMSQARGFAVGGTVHVVINNQVGFTTHRVDDVRSTLYCTDVAKMVGAPILHVNGDDPEAVVFCAQLAFDFRQRFRKDVVIDLVCYRKHGHNEQDEPDGHATPDVPEHPGGAGRDRGRRCRADDQGLSRCAGRRPPSDRPGDQRLPEQVLDRLDALHQRALHGEVRHHRIDDRNAAAVQAPHHGSGEFHAALARAEDHR